MVPALLKTYFQYTDYLLAHSTVSPFLYHQFSFWTIGEIRPRSFPGGSLLGSSQLFGCLILRTSNYDRPQPLSTERAFTWSRSLQCSGPSRGRTLYRMPLAPSGSRYWLPGVANIYTQCIRRADPLSSRGVLTTIVARPRWPFIQLLT